MVQVAECLHSLQECWVYPQYLKFKDKQKNQKYKVLKKIETIQDHSSNEGGRSFDLKGKGYFKKFDFYSEMGSYWIVMRNNITGNDFCLKISHSGCFI
jgi:hypothetical protein